MGRCGCNNGFFTMTDRRVTDFGLPIGKGTHMGTDYVPSDFSIKWSFRGYVIDLPPLSLGPQLHAA